MEARRNRSSLSPVAIVGRRGESAESDGATLADLYRTVRRATEALCEPLEIEDYVIQSMPDASPVKWHLAHTNWFFETFVLKQHLPAYRTFHPQFGFLFNSYYQSVGPQWFRPERGLLSRPTVTEIYRYRAYVDEQMSRFLLRPVSAKTIEAAAHTVVLGLHHEQQHQELMITDLKHAWSLNPLHPVYRERSPEEGPAPVRNRLTFTGGIASIGRAGEDFAFDNESPRHRIIVPGFRLDTRLVTNAEYIRFIIDGGYDRPQLWLSDGWSARQARGWAAPLYWEEHDGHWFVVTLSGLQPVVPDEPVCHVSYYEADAFARWAGARLPTESEWETGAQGLSVEGHFAESGRFHPAAAAAPGDNGPLYKLYGDVWQWTASPYVSYPGYKPPAGALGEYNSKFMCNQMVLRGASCLTPRSHARRTYRNFFPPDARWQFSGIRLAEDLA